MSASSDLHIETMNLSSEWTSVVAAILNQTAVGRAARQKPDEHPSDEEEWRMYQYAPDLAFTRARESAPVAVEIMMFRWRSNWLGRVGSGSRGERHRTRKKGAEFTPHNHGGRARMP